MLLGTEVLKQTDHEDEFARFLDQQLVGDVTHVEDRRVLLHRCVDRVDIHTSGNAPTDNYSLSIEK